MSEKTAIYNSKMKKSSQKLWKIFIVFIFVAALVLFRMGSEIGRERSVQERFAVARIIDGDTVELAGGDRLRLLAIDTPEKGEPFYDSARVMLKSLVAGEPLEIDYSERRRDRYGRMLGYAWRDTLFINEVMVRAGLASIYLFPDNLADSAVIVRLLGAQREALAERRGIWSREVAGEDFYMQAKGSYRFHRPNCRHIAETSPARLIRYGTREEALRKGLSPCRDCRP